MKYYIKGGGNTVADAYILPSCNGDDVEDAAHIAEYAAEDYNDNHDGWEDSWPIVFTLVYDNGQEIDVSVERECEPVYHGTIRKSK